MPHESNVAKQCNMKYTLVARIPELLSVFLAMNCDNMIKHFSFSLTLHGARNHNWSLPETYYFTQ